MYQFAALVSLLAILLYFFTSTRVARARAKFGVAVPAIMMLTSSGCFGCR